MKTAHLGLGSNLGDRLRHLWSGITHLSKSVTLKKLSRVYESAPMYNTAQPHFLNMVVEVETALSPHELLTLAKQIEKQIGREANTHFEPRPIDVDILLYEDAVIETLGLTVPHARMHERAFVLAPLEEVASFISHPKLGRPIIDLLDELGGYEHTAWVAEEQL